MNTIALGLGWPRPTSFLRTGIFLAAFIGVASLNAQLVSVTDTYSPPDVIDGEAKSIFFDFSTQLDSPNAFVEDINLSIDFSKVADLFDDPPFYSEIGIVLRKLDTSFMVVGEVTLVEFGSFFDGAPGDSFSGTITFDDEATDWVNTDPEQLTAGTFKPVQSLSLLSGAYSPFWELRIVDGSFQNPLFFNAATLTVAALAPIPEPSTYGLVAGLVLLGAAALRRRSARR